MIQEGMLCYLFILTQYVPKLLLITYHSWLPVGSMWIYLHVYLTSYPESIAKKGCPRMSDFFFTVQCLSWKFLVDVIP